MCHVTTPTTDYLESSVPFASIGRSTLSIWRDQVHSMDDHHKGGSGHELELELFQKQVRQGQRHLEIVLAALDLRERAFGEGYLRLAKRALVDLTILMLDEKEISSALHSPLT